MGASIKHKFQSAKPNGAHSDMLQPSHWNEEHEISGIVLSINGQNPDIEGNVAIASEYRLDPSTTGYPTPTFTYTVATYVARDALTPNTGEWCSVAEDATYYFIWNGKKWEQHLQSQSGKQPYIVGDNGETRVICSAGVLYATESAYIMFPCSDATTGNPVWANRNAFLAALPSDTKFSIDSSYAGGGAYVCFPLNSYVRSTIRNCAPTGGSCYRLADRHHIVIEWYPERDGLGVITTDGWSATGDEGILFRNDTSADGWGNPVQVNSEGYLTRCSLSDIEYNFMASPIKGSYSINGLSYIDRDTYRNKVGFNSGFTAYLISPPVEGDRYLFFGTAGPYIIDSGCTGKPIYYSNNGSLASTTNKTTSGATGHLIEVVYLEALNGFLYHEQDFLTYMAGALAWTKIDKTGSKIADIADVNTVGLAHGYMLVWDVPTQKWVVQAGGAGGIPEPPGDGVWVRNVTGGVGTWEKLVIG